MKIVSKFKKGAASFYIIAFSTLILLIIATSFAAIIISEMTRTSNDDLAQSAYDSALAGVEDAKLAYYNYQNCLAGEKVAGDAAGSDLDCSTIMYYVEKPDAQDCDMVAHILGRRPLDESGEVIVSEMNNGIENNMHQAYTCVKIDTVLKSYEGTLSSSEQIKVIKVKFKKPSDNPDLNVADMISKVRLSWFSDENSTSDYRYTNFADGKVVYPQLGDSQASEPPTMSLAMVQTAKEFSLTDFDVTRGETTDRGMVYLTPMNNKEAAKASKDTYVGAWNDTENHIGKSAGTGFLKSNDKKLTNLPYGVYCDPAKDGRNYACSVNVEIPRPVGGERNEDTFLFVVALPYGRPDTDFALEFFCDEDKVCDYDNKGPEDESSGDSSQASLDGVQVEVDSTGRANDLYRRLRVRFDIETSGSYLSLMGPLELLGENKENEDLLNKEYTVKCEYNFGPRTCP